MQMNLEVTDSMLDELDSSGNSKNDDEESESGGESRTVSALNSNYIYAGSFGPAAAEE